jgi:sporulation related protein
MTNSQGRLPQGHPRQPPHPDDRHPAPNGYPPHQGQPSYQQPAYQPPPGHEQPGQAPQSWPPPEPQHNWGQQPYPAEEAANGGQYWHDGQQPAPIQPGYSQPPPAEQAYPDPYAQPQQGQYPAGYPAAPQPADPYRYPNEPGAVAEDPYSHPTLGAGGAGNGFGSLASRLPPVGHPQGSPFAQPGMPTADELAADLNTGRPGAGDYGAGDQHLRGPSFEDWPATAPPEHGGYAQPAPTLPGQSYAGADPHGYVDPGAGYAPHPQDAAGYAGSDQWAQQVEAGYAEAGYQPGPYAAAAAPQELNSGWPQGSGGDIYQQPAAGMPDGYAPSAAPELSAYGQEIAVNNDAEYEDDEEEDEPRSGKSRLVLVAGVLAGVIAIGAGLAYGYKTFVGDGTKVSSGPPVVRGDGRANKARPSDPGGRKFEHSDSKMMGRLSEEGRATAKRNDGGARRVPTVMIGRDGRVVNQGAAPVPYGAPPSEPVVSVPGLTVVDGFAGQREAAARQAKQTAGQPIVVKPPKTAGNALSPVRPAVVNKKPAPPVAQPKAQVPKAVARATPPTSVPTTKPRKPAAPAAPRASSGGNGYVAVLASVPVSGTSRLEALKTFADIQQNFGSVLKNRTPDVREANLGAKGRYHRLMVGPPSSRENANTLCKELKSAGYPSCWITSY